MSSVSLGAGEAGDEGLKKLAASAALIKAILTQQAADAPELQLLSPQLRFKSDGDIEAWVHAEGAAAVEMFSAWPNKFAQLAFGFACDHFKMLHEDAWKELVARAGNGGGAVLVDPAAFEVGALAGLSAAPPERLTAPALMAMCERMASTPGWLMGALDDLEHGRSPFGLERDVKKARPPR